MGDLMLTGLDETVLARLSSRAAEHGRTLEAEAAEILTQKLAADSQPVDEAAAQHDVWSEMDQSRQKTGRLDVSTIDLLREDRDGRCD